MPMTSLRNSREFSRVYRHGRKARSDGLTVFAAPNEGAGPRIGLAVPGRFGNAVKRNRMKRRLRGALQALELHHARDLVVRVDPQAGDLSSQELETHLLTALTAAGAVQ